jgi:K+-transporting ATPase A subunit
MPICPTKRSGRLPKYLMVKILAEDAKRSTLEITIAPALAVKIESGAILVRIVFEKIKIAFMPTNSWNKMSAILTQVALLCRGSEKKA